MWVVPNKGNLYGLLEFYHIYKRTPEAWILLLKAKNDIIFEGTYGKFN